MGFFTRRCLRVVREPLRILEDYLGCQGLQLTQTCLKDSLGLTRLTGPASHKFEFLTFRDFLVQPLSLQNYHEFEVSKYKILSKRSTCGYYILRKSCILKPRIRGSFRDLEFPINSGEKKNWKSHGRKTTNSRQLF